MSRVAVLIKTSEGGAWILPQVKELRRQDHDVVVILPGAGGRLRRELDAAGIAWFESPFDFCFAPRVATARGLFQLRRSLKEWGPDLLFYHLYASALASRLSTLGMKVRRVHMVPGPLFLESPLIRVVERLLCRLDDEIIAGSCYTRRIYRSIGMPSNRVSVVPYGIDTDRFQKGDDCRASLLGVGRDTFVAVMVAYVYAPKRLVHRGVGIKGHDLLLDAWDRFHAEHKDTLLVLVGSGFDDEGERYRQYLREKYQASRASGVLWLDSVEDVQALYSSADISISPSLSDNHGAAVEASAMSVPSIVSDAGALPEVVSRGEGWVFPKGDAAALNEALERAFESFRGGTLRSMGAAARQHAVSQFSSKETAADVVSTLFPAARVVAFTEQRVWIREGKLHGYKGLPIVQMLGERMQVELAARLGHSDGAGVCLASAAEPLPLTWPAGWRAPWDGLRLLTRLIRAIRGASVVYADQPGIVGGVGLGIARAMGKRLVVNVVGDSHESVHPRVVPGWRGQVGHRVFPRVQQWACAHATYVNYVTQQVLQTRYPAKRAREVFATSTVSALGPSRPRPYRSDKVSVVTIGSMDRPYKGITELVEAVGLCRESGLDVRLTVVGEGRLRRSLEQEALKRLPNAVVFTGHLYGEDLYDELGKHDVFALASWTEGLPRALVEAMADGMPAVGTAVGGVPELLERHRVVAPFSSKCLALGMQDLLRSNEGWDQSVDHNLRVSKALLERRAPVLRKFVDSIVHLSRMAPS